MLSKTIKDMGFQSTLDPCRPQRLHMTQQEGQWQMVLQIAIGLC